MSISTIPEVSSNTTAPYKDLENGSTESEFHKDYAFLSSLVFYSLLIPIGIIGNLLSTVVVGYLMKYKRTRRITADLLLGLLAIVDLLCIIAIHSISIAALSMGKWPYPYEVCAYQGFATAVYLQLEFFLQVGISIDRYVALTRPIQYQQMSPSKLTRITPVILIILSVGTITVMIGWSPRSAKLLNSWYFCMFIPNPTTSTVDTVVVAILTTVFFVGFVTFIYCNINLVRILWQYNAQKTKHVLQELSVAVQVMEKKTANSKHAISQPASPEVQNGKLLQIRNSQKSKSASRQSIAKSPVFQPQDKDQEIMNDLMSDIVQLRHRLSTQMQVAPFLSASTGNIPGSRKSSVSRIKDVEIKINKTALDATTSAASSETIDIIDDSNKLQNKEESSLEDIVIQVPKLPMIEHTKEKHEDLFCTTYIPKIKRSRTFSDIEEASHSSCSSKENSNSSLNDLHRSRSMDKMHKFPSSDSASFKSSNNLQLPPGINHKSSHQKKLHKDRPMSPRTRLDAFGSSQDVTPEASPDHRVGSQRKYKSKKPPNVVLSNGHTNSAMQVRENGTPTSARPENEEHISHFQRQMRKLLKRVEKKAEKQRREILLARLVLLCALVFLITWFPFVIMNMMMWANVTVPNRAFDIAVKLVFSNVILNPVFYGLCRSNYRKGYGYILHMVGHFLCCGLINKPGDEKAFFDSKKRKQKRLQAAAEINMNQRINKMRKRRISAHALQVLHTLHFQNIITPPKSPLTFKPSAKLQNLFDKYEAESDSDTDSSSIDYDILALDINQGPENFYKSLRHMWSMYVLNGDEQNGQQKEEDEEDFDLDIDYDAMLDDDLPIEHPSFLDCDKSPTNARRYSEGSYEKDNQSNSSSVRLAVSTPSGSLQRQLDNVQNNNSSEQLITKL